MPVEGTADVFQALARESTLASRVILQMQAMIADGRLKEGSKLPAERDLARQFGVSRTVIREAVAALAAKELLQVEAGSGTTVRRPSLGAVSTSFGLYLGSGVGLDLRKVAETRRLLLADTAALAAERNGEEDLEKLAGILREAENDREVAVAFVKWVAAFHAAVAKASGNEVSATVVAMLDEQLHDQAVRAASNAIVTERWLRNLQGLMKPLRKRDAKGSRQGMRDLLLELEETLVLGPMVRR